MSGKIDLLPDSAAVNFLIRRCLVEQRMPDLHLLRVTVPAAGLIWRAARVDPTGTATWTAPAALGAAALHVRCAAGTPRRHDPLEYPDAPRYADGVELVFEGSALYGRSVDDVSPALLVHVAVRSIDGLPAGLSWSGFHTIELSNVLPSPGPGAARSAHGHGGGDTGTSGPHQPFP